MHANNSSIKVIINFREEESNAKAQFLFVYNESVYILCNDIDDERLKLILTLEDQIMPNSRSSQILAQELYKNLKI